MTTSATRVQLVDPDTGEPYNSGGRAYTLADNAAIAAGGNTNPVINVSRGVYVWDAQFSGTGPLKLQSLGADKTNWRDVASLSSSGTFVGEIRIGANASLRLFSATALTAVSSNIS